MTSRPKASNIRQAAQACLSDIPVQETHATSPAIEGVACISDMHTMSRDMLLYTYNMAQPDHTLPHAAHRCGGDRRPAQGCQTVQ